MRTNNSLQRVSIVGCSGAGKTTLGCDLALRLGVEAVDLDELHWLPGWQTRTKGDFDALLGEVLTQENWVISGNYSRVRGQIWARAQTLIWLDYSLPVVMKQVVQRTFRRNFHGEPCCNGNQESLRLTFSRESIVLWALRTHGEKRREYSALFSRSEFTHLQVLRFRSPRQTRDWLSQI
ncbi:MAG TPA: hypothetical protein VGB45_01295 [Abditibacterium sp.]|jgi:adenylate kinase family enzyme